MRDTLPDLSIVIVSFNVRELLRACLESIQCHTRGSEDPRRLCPNMEVVVVDNASSDGSAEMVRQEFPHVHLIANETNAGFAAANNQGIRASRGRHVLLLNPDTEVWDDALAKLVGFLDHHPGYAAAGAGLVYADGAFQHSAFRFPGPVQCFLDFFPINHRLTNSRLNGRYPRAWYERGQPFDVDHPLGACLAVRREAIDQVGPLDEGFFMYCEEIDWCWRMRKAGWKIACVPAARVVHHAGASARQFRDEMFVALWRSRFRLFGKHVGSVQRRLIGWIVRLGVQRERLRMTNQATSSETGMADLMSRLAAYEEVAELWRRDGGDVGVREDRPGGMRGTWGNPSTGLRAGWGNSEEQGKLGGTVTRRISAVVLTRNEADNIAECLDSLAWADDRIVLDSFSNDDTVTLAQQAGARAYQRRFRDYADQRNAALDLIATDWVFFVDADERATPELADEIRRVTAHRARAGWWVPRHNYIFGHRMRGTGWYPDYQLRLFQRDLGWYNPHRQVHEVVILGGPAGYLENPLIHYNYDNLREFRQRQAQYTDYDAAILYAAGQRARPHNLILQPLREFRRRFWSEAGYRDRFHGLLLSALMSYYEYVKYRKLWRLQRQGHVVSRPDE